MENAATENSSEISKPHVNQGLIDPLPTPPSFISIMMKDFFLEKNIWKTLTNVNLLTAYLFTLAYVAGSTFNGGFILFYLVLVFIFQKTRSGWQEKKRKEAAHRIPFFADAVANSLAVGSTLEQAFHQSVYYLRGDLKVAFEQVMAKNIYGKDLGVLLRELDAQFPKTGLKYLISLLEEYRDLGIGISPLLKQMAEALTIKEGAEEKIQNILAGGSNYARLAMIVFGASFGAFCLLLRDQVHVLIGPELQPILISLVGWALAGMVIVTRITSLDFASHFALRPYITGFMTGKQWSSLNLISYSGLHKNLEFWSRVVLFSPLLVGIVCAMAISWYNGNPLILFFGFLIGVMLGKFSIEFCLKGLVEDQVIRAVELFPDFLQVYIIGLNSGLNSFLSFQFADRSIEGVAPEVMRREIHRAKCSLQYGENHTKAWQRLADKLPFEIIIDFCETMIISPMHGESIGKSLVQMMNSYQAKKLSVVEKKAAALGQTVIPVIVLAFFPLFLFVIFAPLWLRIMSMF